MHFNYIHIVFTYNIDVEYTQQSDIHLRHFLNSLNPCFLLIEL